MEEVKLAPRPCGKTESVYIPQLAYINNITALTEMEKLFEIRFKDSLWQEHFKFQAGQFMMLSLMGVGEAPFSISSSPSRKGYLEFCIRKMGNLTSTLHRMKIGDTVGLRGPFGKGFPFEEMKGSDILLVAGGLGLAPLRSLIINILDNRADFGDITILYGSKTFRDILFWDQLKQWEERKDLKLYVTVDEADSQWNGRIGLVTDLFSCIEINSQNVYAAICGPSVMYKFVIQELVERSVPKGRILVSLERRMSCGIGKCGHCGIGYKYTCIDGPVFNYWEVMNLQEAI